MCIFLICVNVYIYVYIYSQMCVCEQSVQSYNVTCIDVFRNCEEIQFVVNEKEKLDISKMVDCALAL